MVPQERVNLGKSGYRTKDPPDGQDLLASEAPLEKRRERH